MDATDSFKLVIRAKKLSILEGRLSYVINNGEFSGKLFFRKDTVLELPRKMTHIWIYGRKKLFAPRLEKEFLIIPNERCHTAVVEISKNTTFYVPFVSRIMPTQMLHAEIRYEKFDSEKSANGIVVTRKNSIWKKICRGGCLFFAVFPIAGLLSVQTVTDAIPRLFGIFWYLLLLWLFVIAANFYRQRKSISVDLDDPFVLYLRSFQDDDKTRKSPAPFTSLGRTEEELLVELLFDISPVVAIGNPRDKSLPLGAARIYVDDSKWQETVLSMMDSSVLVVLRLGETSNFWWEVSQALSKCPKEKLLFVIPSMKKRESADRLAQYFRDLGITVPEDFCLTVRKVRKGSIAGIIYFKDGVPVCEQVKLSRFITYSESVYNLLYPLFRKFGFREKKINRSKRILVSVLLIVILCFITKCSFKEQVFKGEYRLTYLIYRKCTNDSIFKGTVDKMNEPEKINYTHKLVLWGSLCFSDDEFYDFMNIVCSSLNSLPEKDRILPLKYIHSASHSNSDAQKYIQMSAKAAMLAFHKSPIKKVAQEDISEELKICAEICEKDGRDRFDLCFYFQVSKEINNRGLNGKKFLRYIYQEIIGLQN